MFEYTCPTCQATTKVQNLQSGTVTACETCGQGLRVVLKAQDPPPRASSGLGCMALVVGGCGLLGMTFASLIVLAWAVLTPDAPGNPVVVVNTPKPPPPVADNPPPVTKRGEPTTEKAGGGLQSGPADKLANARTTLHDLDPKVRQAAVTAIGEFGPEGSAAVGDLAEALKDLDEGVRAAAATALGKVGPKVQDVFPDLLTALNDPALLVRDAAGRTLDSLGSPPSSRLPLLREALRDPRSQSGVRLYALRALAASKGEAKENLPLFTEALKNRDAEVRLEAVRGLGKFGPAARDAVFPPLAAAMDDGDAGVREAAFDVGSHLGAPGSADVPALRGGLKAKAVKARAATAPTPWRRSARPPAAPSRNSARRSTTRTRRCGNWPPRPS